jgi:glucose-6-phosphate dehydrogenase assembly protein OpcA
MEPQQPFALSAPTAVEPHAIARGLTDLWKRADEQLRDSGQRALIRSCTLNFVVLLPRADLIPQAADTAAALTLRHPCRIFLVGTEPQAEADKLESSVSALCHIPSPGGPHICCEQVTVAARGEAVSRLTQLILGLLIPDIPLVVWWHRGLSFDLPLFEGLVRIADRLIVDTAEFDPPAAALTRLARLLEQRPLTVTDLAWGRLTCWRELTAQFFDAPQQRPYLDRLDRVAVETSGEAPRAEGLLWLDWLASRLGWTPTGARALDQGYAWTFDSRGRGVLAEVRGGGSDSQTLRRFELAAGGEARFVVEQQQPGCVLATAHVRGQSMPPRTVPLPSCDAVQLLSDELDFVGRDHVYEEALGVAALLVEFLVE